MKKSIKPLKKSIKPLLLLNKKGQMAVFIVLIFQVLFVLFAMVVNIGLIVHDKINLQNSVDLAAYYAAQRQAESLNVIAHQNYQIRQAWKLLSWRYFVLGTSSMRPNHHDLVHPAAIASNSQNDECFQYFQAYPSNLQPPGKCKKLPVICMSDIYPWDIKTNIGVSSADQYCRVLNLQIDQLQSPGLTSSSVVNISEVMAQAAKVNAQIKRTCSYASAMQLVYASSILTAFDHEQSNRLKTLYGVAVDLSTNRDIDGKSVKKGAFKVFAKNLSYSNTKDINYSDFKLFNSVSAPNLKPSSWLVPIVVNPAIIFAQLDSARGGCSGTSGTAEVLGTKHFSSTGRFSNYAKNAFIKIFPSNYKSVFWQSSNSVSKIEGRSQPQMTSFVNSQKPGIQDPRFLSVGVEKNPWYRVYVGISATTSPVELFWIGKKIKLKATAFATPFGGRVGPWYGKNWQQGALMSNGTDRQNRIDQLLPPRDTFQGSSATTNQLAHEFVPNFSRFPGDTMGLFSSQALAAVKLGSARTFSVDALFQPAFSGKTMIGGGVKLQAKSTLSKFADANNKFSPRNMELAAISSNIFDITYYSVFPDANNSFMKRLSTFVASAASQDSVTIRNDVGNYTQGNSLPTTLRKRIDLLNNATFNNVTVIPKFGKFITKPKDLLTGWLPNGPYRYSFNTNAFQKCSSSSWADKKVPVMGSCYQGGRVGYSVKIISKNLLTNGTILSLGGEGTSGRILNPPPTDF